MNFEDKVRAVVYTALSNLNEEQPDNQKIELSDDAILFGGNSAVDSLSLVSVIIDVETEISTEFDRPIALTDDRAMTRQPSPFDSVGNLIAYVVELLQE